MGLFSAIAGLFGARRRGRTIHVDAGRPVRASSIYDAAESGNETTNVWATANALDADATNSLAVRKKLRERSRREEASNGYYAGILRTHANYVIGRGPTLQLETQSDGFNAMVEAAWRRWCKATGFVSKLRTLAMSRYRDGESFAQLAVNASVADQVKLDVVPIECDQVTAPVVKAALINNYVDGITYDEFGTPTSYDVLRRHPGAQWAIAIQEYDTRPAAFIVHWFRADRSGQHRGVPEATASLNTFPTARRYREAVIAAAETAADFAAVMEMPATNEGPDEVRPFTSVPIEKRMFVASPAGGKLTQMRAEQPTAQHESVCRQILNEGARPFSMPYNVAACDSASYNYASGRLDHQTYYVGVDVELEDAESRVIDPVFAAWFREATSVYGWTGDGSPPVHSWLWSGGEHVDPYKEASAQELRLKTHCTTLKAEYAAEGKDWEAEIRQRAKEVELLRTLNLPMDTAPTANQQQNDPNAPEAPPQRPTPRRANASANGHHRFPELIHGDG